MSLIIKGMDMPTTCEECSVCGWECNDTYTCDSEFKYCPNCGIELEE